MNGTEYRSQVGSVLALLIESGTLYCVIWVSGIVLEGVYASHTTHCDATDHLPRDLVLC